jgi:hypothetical protein
MDPKQKRYSSIMFLVSFISLTTYAQDITVEKPTFSNVTTCVKNVASEVQNQNVATISVADSNISSQFIAKLSNSKDCFAMQTVVDNDAACAVEKSNVIAGRTTYSELARAIIENYRYDFSETFIDILFFDNIDLARKRTI